MRIDNQRIPIRYLNQLSNVGLVERQGIIRVITYRQNSSEKRRILINQIRTLKKGKKIRRKRTKFQIAFLIKETRKKSESKDIEWIIDLAKDFVKHTNSKVIADNTKLEMKGKNKEHILLVVEKKTMIVPAKEILYVPKLHVNLQSVNQMAKNVKLLMMRTKL